MSGKLEERKKIFERYSASLAAWKVAHAGQYACPLCLELYREDAIHGAKPTLTLEHVIPRGLGQCCYVLTCRDCTSAAGSKVDIHLHTRIRKKQELQAGVPIEVRLIYGGGIITATFERNESGLHLRIVEERSDPKAVAALRADMEAQKFDSMRMQWTTTDMHRSRVALLKSAYLLMFHGLGYSYVLTPVLDDVRKQIAEPKASHVPLDKLVFQPVPSSEDKIPKRIGLIVEPGPLSAFIVGVRLTKTNEVFGVVMPTSPHTYRVWSEWAKLHPAPPVYSFEEIAIDSKELTQPTFAWRD